MLVLNPNEIKQLDQFTISQQNISGIELMERAVQRCYHSILENTHLLEHSTNTIHIFCGPGNNGGDGYALALLLKNEKKKIKVYDALPDRKKSSETEFYYQKNLSCNIQVQRIRSEKDFPSISKEDLIIDCIFGIGLNKAIEGVCAELINYLNSVNSIRVSIDIPSGLFAEDNSSNDLKKCFRADYTFTFQSVKYSFLLPECAFLAGKYFIVNIGLEDSLQVQKKKRRIYLEKSFVSHQIKRRSKFSHKGTYGHVLVFAGQTGKIGAAVLSCKACLRGGAGLVTAYLPKSGNDIMQISVPEVMVITSDEEHILSGMPDLSNYSCIAIGPGIGVDEQTVGMMKRIIQDSNLPMVIDADALNIISKNKTWLGFLKPGTILTPHPKEFDRIFGDSKNTSDRHSKQIEASIKFQIYIVLKGAHSSISCPDGTIYFNSTGNPGMATAGMGDVLTGIIAAFLSAKYSPETACVCAVYTHGLSADLSLSTQSYESLIASDVIDNLGYAMHTISA